MRRRLQCLTKKEKLDLCNQPDHVEYLHASDHGEEDQHCHQPNNTCVQSILV